MKWMIRVSLAIISALVMSLPVRADELRSERIIPLGLAYEAASAAADYCKEKGWKVSVAVVDHSGQLQVLLRGDGAAPHTIEASRRKAYTSLSTRTATSTVLENIQKNPAAANMSMIDGFLILGGAIPLKAGDDVIGAIGVSGSPAGNLDDQCAEAGIKKIRDRLK